MSILTRGSMPPNLAIVAWFGAFEVAHAQSAAAAASLVSGIPASRTKLHSGAIAPARATAP